jgi:hypothetical protein
MLARAPVHQFSLARLIGEARRRARRRRALIGVGIVLVAGAAASAMLLARTPGGGPAQSPGGSPAQSPGGGNGSAGDSLSKVQASFKGDPTQPPVTAAAVAAAHRDEARMLGLFVPPPGARRVANEPAFYRPQIKQILARGGGWGTDPQKSGGFVRFAYWHVHASVARVARFERAHRPTGSITGGRYYGSTRTKTPRHATSRFTCSPIGSLVTNRHMQVWILRLPSHQTAIGVAVSNSPWPRGSWGPFRGNQVWPIITRQPPVAGQPFTGVEVIDVNPRIEPLTHLVCNATLGSHALPVVQHVFTTAPPPRSAGGFARWVAGLARSEKVNKVEAVTCTWQIPANAAGQHLQLGTGPRGSNPLEGYGLRAETAPTPSHPSGGFASAPSWVVRP